MILRIDRLALELPAPTHPLPNSASAVRELLGGKFGEMSTLTNDTFQSFNFRGRDKWEPFYDLIANIGAEDEDTGTSSSFRTRSTCDGNTVTHVCCSEQTRST